MTFNEPWVAAILGYYLGIHAPGHTDMQEAAAATHHLLLAHGQAVPVIRRDSPGGEVGIVLNYSPAHPASDREEDIHAAHMNDAAGPRMFLDPLVHGVWPPELLALLEQHQVTWETSEEDLAVIREHTVDELGINLYYPHRVKAPSRAWHPHTPFHPAWYYEPFELPGRRMNASRGWEIYPQIIFDMAMRIKNDYRNIPWFVAESGMGVENEGQFRNREGVIDDSYRIRFISEHLWHTLRAREAGANCQGYMLWAFTDNVSPMNAFKNRYGLIEIDLQNHRARRPKASAHWFRQLGERRELVLDIDDEYR